MEALFYLLICLSATYGLISLISLAAETFGRRMAPEKGRIRLVLLVKDAEDVIEGVIHNAYSGQMLAKTASDGILTVVDMNSADGTPEILKRLKDGHGAMEVLTPEDAAVLFSVFSEERI